MTITYESRSILEPVEFRSDTGRLVASGVAMRYDAKSKVMVHPSRGMFRETFRPGSLTKTIQEADVRSHLEHEGPYLARSANESLRLIDGRSELGYEIDLPDTTAGRDAAALLERRDVRGSSVGFRSITATEQWSKDDDGTALRTVNEARLFRVDLTTNPAYTQTTADLALRSFAEANDLELRSVLDAVEHGTSLADLLDQEPVEDRSDTDDDGRETTVVTRPRILSLYA